MVEKLWFREDVPVWAAPLWPISKLFGAVARYRRQRYLSGKAPCYRAPVPVIVVGNIMIGGNGKTPFVVWLVEQLKAQGYRPGVVSRGYGGKSEQYPLLLSQTTSPRVAGDEPVLIARRTQVPVCVDPDRSAAVKRLLDEGVNVVVTDDGMQHYRLDRDLEIVIVDGQRRFGNGHYIPLGPLREHTSRLATVDMVVNNGGEPHQGEWPMTLVPTEAVNLRSGQRCQVSILPEVVAMAGIGHPPRFFATLQKMGVTPVHSEAVQDHQSLSAEALDSLAAKGQHLLMTEKDAVKYQGIAQDNWWYLPVAAKLPDTAANYVLEKLHHLKKHKN
ncbi:tetraacyldisaccharide 4'-kinase [Salinivibrio sp. PR919]|uniref:tetraacyldisaccharide 4'-kinase n=1 Tax=Salinivibrio sp. PR919 TaxID=1909491 RepID=UPI000985E8C7|nr:tetraacyldisaccharide 4'-kinase [Salinivibrio sp. PR919]